MTLKPEHIVEALNKKTFDEIDPDEVLKHYGYKPEEVRCNGVGIGVWRKEEAFQKLGDIGAYKESDSSATLKAKTGNIGNGGECLVAERVVRWIVRRLTPTECERLQGYPDGWTDIGEWTDTKGKKHKPADTPRYKALGNSIALPQWFWIAQKMRPYLKDKPTLGSLFDGIGGFPLVWETAYGAGTAVWASEIEEFPIAVTKRWFGNDTENESNSGAVLRG